APSQARPASPRTTRSGSPTRPCSRYDPTTTRLLRAEVAGFYAVQRDLLDVRVERLGAGDRSGRRLEGDALDLAHVGAVDEPGAADLGRGRLGAGEEVLDANARHALAAHAGQQHRRADGAAGGQEAHAER